MVLFAFSIQDQVEKYGAYVGLAAFLGLAVLTVLYFAQARELKRLRDWAGRAPERAQELEARVVATADEARRTQVAERSGTVGPARPVAQPAAAPAPAPASGNGTGDHPVIPIGPRPAVAVAAVAARAQATAVAEPAPAEPATGGDEEAPAPDGAPEPEETQLHDTIGGDAAAATLGGDAPPVEETPAEDEAPKSDPSGNGTGEHPVIPRATPRPQPQPKPQPAAAPLRATPAAARSAPAAPSRHRRPSLGGSSSAARITALTLTGVVVLAAIVFAITQLFGGGSSQKPAPNVTQPTQSSAKTGGGGSSGPTAAQLRPDTVVAILNGTPTEGLASGARDKLIAKGYSDTDGMIRTGNNTDQQRQDSAVFFAPGKRKQARDVASILGISASPQAVDPDTLALANATGTGGKSADVVAVLGLDQSP